MNQKDIARIKPYLEKKIVKGITYYQLVRKARMNGKVKRVWSKYLGTPEKMEEVYNCCDNIQSSLTIHSYEYGKTAALLTIAEELNFIEIVNKHTTKKRIDGLTVGEYLLLISLGRASGPISKKKTADWFRESFLDIIWSIPHKLNTQNFTNHMDYLTDDVIEKIEDDLGQILVNKGIKPSILFFDTTNFFTFIEHGDKLPQKGKSKEKRNDKNIVGLGMAVSDENRPFFHEVYPGNIHDSKVFSELFKKFLNRLDAINVPAEDIILVFDKGCNSEDNVEEVLSKMHIVGSAKKNQVQELYNVHLTDFEPLYKTKNKHDVKAYRMKKELFGTEFTVVISYNSGSYKKQSETYEKKKIEILEKLEKIKQSVERVGKGKKKNIKNALIDASKTIPNQYKKAFVFQGDENKGVFMYEVNKEEEKKLYLDFGKNVIFTDLHDWSSEKIVKTYNRKDMIEKDFMWLKNVLIMPIKPIYLQKDERIKVHSFLCVMGLLFYRYMLWKLKMKDFMLSEQSVIEELEKVRIALVKKDDQKPTFVFEKMDINQMRLFSTLRLERVLKDIKIEC